MSSFMAMGTRSPRPSSSSRRPQHQSRRASSSTFTMSTNCALAVLVLSAFATVTCATSNTTIPIVIVNNHNHSSSSSSSDNLITEPVTYETLSAEYTTGPAMVTLSTGTVVSQDIPNRNASQIPTSPAAGDSNSSSLFYYDQQVLVTGNGSVVSTRAPPLLGSTVSLGSDEPVLTSGSEIRPRWVDYRSRPAPAFPPRVPTIHGIPSGFRNPVTPPYGIQHASASAPTHPHPFGGSSSNPVGFAGSVPAAPASFPASNANQDRRRPTANITRVEHIVAECSDDYMKVVVHFNGTFTGLIYSSGYVHDPNCIYVNGTGRNHYEFFIRLNQCGTLGRQEMYHPKRPGEVRRRDQVMWNTMSIQYNSMIEEEWDEHYRVTCEYGSDFWKTVTFPAVNVEVNTGSPVVFTINPPQCQMEVRRGFGISGTRTSGPVTVGDPLTLLIHMKSEKAGFDILVKNCIAHNGAQQKLQLIDPNGCVTNEKLISPFRGTYNTDDGHQVTLYAYLKAFRFTGSPALYLECDIHMCHNKCPPQRCYWRNLSKRSVRSIFTERPSNITEKPVISESISLFQALEVRHEPDEEQNKVEQKSKQIGGSAPSSVCFRPDGVAIFGLIISFILISSTMLSVCSFVKMRRLRKLCDFHAENNSLYKTAMSYENLYYPTSRRRF